jgi:hypothetical protein
MEDAIQVMLEHIMVEDAYPNLTRKSAFIQEALLAATKNPDIRFRIKHDKHYTSKIAQVVKLFL